MAVEHEETSDGKVVPFASLSQTATLDGAGRVSYVEAVWQGATYRQTLTYGASTVTSSMWVKQ